MSLPHILVERWSGRGVLRVVRQHVENGVAPREESAGKEGTREVPYRTDVGTGRHINSARKTPELSARSPYAMQASRKHPTCIFSVNAVALSRCGARHRPWRISRRNRPSPDRAVAQHGLIRGAAEHNGGDAAEHEVGRSVSRRDLDEHGTVHRVWMRSHSASSLTRSIVRRGTSSVGFIALSPARTSR